MRVLLAGSTGVIGRRVIPLLREQGHQVTALTRDGRQLASLMAAGAEPAVADAFGAAQLSAAVLDAAPDVVMHQLSDLAGADLAANAKLRRAGTRNLVDAAHAAGVRRIVAQSISWAYAPAESTGDAAPAAALPAVESEPLDLHAAEPRRTTVSGVAALEAAVAEAPEWVVLRYGTLYGPGSWYARDGARGVDARARVLAADANVTSFIHVDDAAAAAVAALDWPTGAVNVCDDEPAAGRSWLPVFCRMVGAPDPDVNDADVDDAERAPWARGADNGYARSLGLTLRFASWRAGFADGLG